MCIYLISFVALVGLSDILDSELSGRKPAKGLKVVGAAVMDGELLCKVVQRIKTMVGLEVLLDLPVAVLHPDAPASIPLNQFFEEISRGIGTLLRVGSQEAQAGELTNDRVLEQSQLRGGDTARGTIFTSTWTC